MNTGRLIGVLVGMAVGVLIAVISAKFFNKGVGGKAQYDERQELVRGKAFKWAYTAVMIYVALLIVLGIAEITVPLESAVLYFSIIFVGVIFQVSYLIWNDAYWGLNTSKPRFWISMFIICIINAGVVVTELKDSLIYNGKLSTPGINLLCAVLFGIVGIECAIKSLIEKKTMKEED